MDLDKLFEKLPYDRIIPIPTWQRLAAVGAIVALVLGAFYFVVIKGKDEQIVKLRADLAKIQKEVEDNRRYAQKLNMMKAKIKKLEVALKKASKQLPTEKQIPELLEQVSNIGTQSGLEFTKFKPRGEVRKEYYSEVPVNLQITGRFHNLLVFFDEIAHMKRIVTLNNIKMRSGSRKTGYTNLTVDCVATTYRFVERKTKNGKGKKGKSKKKHKGKRK